MTLTNNTTFEDNCNEYDEYSNAIKLKKRLLSTYEGRDFTETFNGNELTTEWGSCYSIENRSRLKFNTLSIEKAREKIISDLKLLNGIGEVRAQKLRSEGFNTIEDLTEHEKYGGDASKFIKIVNNCDTCSTADWICECYPKSHPLVLFSSSFNDNGDFIFLDIETLGLFNRPIILLGVAAISGNKIKVNQYLSRSVEEENAVLSSFLNHILPESVYVTFNGQTFDIPFIIKRMKHYNIKKDVSKMHFDMLHYSRRAWSDDMPNCQLNTIEKCIFGIEREDDIPSGLVPEFYKSYDRTGNLGPLVPIIEHNRQDIVSLAKIFSRLHKEWNDYDSK